MAGRDILKALFGPRPKKANVARAGNYVAPVDPVGVDTAMRRTLGLGVGRPAVREVAVPEEHDAVLDSLARRAGRYVPPRKPRK